MKLFMVKKNMLIKIVLNESTINDHFVKKYSSPVLSLSLGLKN